MKRIYWLLACGFLVPLAPFGLALAESPPAQSNTLKDSELTAIEQSYLDLNRAAKDYIGKPDRARAVAQVYADHFRPLQNRASLGSLSDRDLNAMFRAAATMTFYDPVPERLSDLRMDLAQLEHRGIATSDQITTVYGALYQSRSFPDMAAFSKAHAEAGLPAAVTSTKPIDTTERHLVLDVNNSSTVTPRIIPLENGVQIVVISNPGCHFTQWAVQAIENDPDMRALMATHSTWVAPADPNIDLAHFVAWNAAHPEAQISLAGSHRSWPEVDIWQTPLFLYFKNGALVDEVVGWPREGNMAALKAAWAKASTTK